MSEIGPSVPAPGGVRRTPLLVDHEAGVLRTGGRSVPVPPDGDALASYLSMIYAARGLEKGSRIPLRDEDLNVLAGLVGDDATQVESRLIELMDCTPAEARRLRALLFRRRSLATAAGIALGLAALAGGAPGVIRLQESSGTALGSPGGATPSSLVQLQVPGPGSVGPATSLDAVPVASSTPAPGPAPSPAGEVGAFVDDPIDGPAADDGGSSPGLDGPASDTMVPDALPPVADDDAGLRSGRGSGGHGAADAGNGEEAGGDDAASGDTDAGGGDAGDTGSQAGADGGTDGADAGSEPGVGDSLGQSDHGGGRGRGNGGSGGSGNHYGTGGTDAGNDDQGDHGVAGSQGQNGNGNANATGRS